MTRSKYIKVRFNLGAGKNYLKWKIERPNGSVTYHDPVDVRLIMHDCILRNHKSTATRIFNGDNKTVCSWILCKEIHIVTNGVSPKMREDNRLYYNPRISPNWIHRGENADSLAFDKIVSDGRNVYVDFNP